MIVFKEFTFEAAHRLPNVPAEHKCARLHGHSFRVTVHVEGDVGRESAWVTDFADVERAFAPRWRISGQAASEMGSSAGATGRSMART